MEKSRGRKVPERRREFHGKRDKKEGRNEAFKGIFNRAVHTLMSNEN